MDLLTARDGWCIQTKHKDLDYLSATWVLPVWVRQAYPQPTTPKQLQTHALGMLTQGQACELDMASHPEGFGWGLRQWQNNKSIL